ncbi:MAG: DUF5667 domain-containing protein [Candidatus Adlerbacteria bacterium]
MNKLHNHLQNETAGIRLSDAEKSAMRLRLEEAMSVLPPVVKPAGDFAAPVRIPSPYAWIFLPRSLALSALALLLIVSTSSAYAAEGSLPGGTLYSVKTNVLEPIKVALAQSPAAKAQVNADIATVRVQEAQTLAERGELTPQVAQEISDNYTRHATEALALAKDSDVAAYSLKTKGKNRASVLQATTTAVIAVAPQAAPAVEEEAPTTVHTMAMNAVIAKKASLVAMPPVATTTTPTDSEGNEEESDEESFAGRMHASLEVQANILHGLHIDVRAQNKNRRD